MMASEVKDTGDRTFCQEKKKTYLDRFHYGRVLRGDEAVECSVLEELTLTAGDMLKQKVVSDRPRRFDKKQQSQSARLRSRVM